jgi:hypothetical protein
MNDYTDKYLAEQFEELRALGGEPWSAIDTWSSKVRPYIRRCYPGDVEQFDKLVRAPRYPSPILVGGGSRAAEIFDAEGARQRRAHREARNHAAIEDSKKQFREMCDKRYERVVAFVEGLLESGPENPVNDEKAMNPLVKNAQIILEALQSIDTRGVDGPDMGEVSELDVEQVNDGVEFLEQFGLVEVTRLLNTAPFRFGEVTLTVQGKYALGELESGGASNLEGVLGGRTSATGNVNIGTLINQGGNVNAGHLNSVEQERVVQNVTNNLMEDDPVDRDELLEELRQAQVHLLQHQSEIGKKESRAARTFLESAEDRLEEDESIQKLHDIHEMLEDIWVDEKSAECRTGLQRLASSDSWVKVFPVIAATLKAITAEA